MIDPAVFLTILQGSGVIFFAGIPDSLLQPLCAQLFKMLPTGRHIIAANEGSAVGLVAGYHLATGAIGCVYMQNSGLGNAINPLTSLMDTEVYSIPALLLIGWRGELLDGKQINDEPQHVKQGRITLDLLDCLSIPYVVLHAETSNVGDVVDHLVNRARTESRPVALVVRKGTFVGGEASVPASNYPLTREEGLKTVLAFIPDDAVVVSTTGKASRELHEMRIGCGRQPSRDFLTVGSMGHALQIASGVALAKPGKTVVCIDGDGALIMHMGGMTTSAILPNLLHVVMNNGSHESVGGQPTMGFTIDMPALARACGYAVAWRATESTEVGCAIKEALSERRSSFLEIRIRSDSRANLGRPESTLREAKRGFMRSLGITPSLSDPNPDSQTSELD
jgi:phosphonopyruvate decarboxylase